MIGLQYLKDIAISRNSSRLFDEIKAGKITYDKISKSTFFYNVNESYAAASSRINQFPNLKEFLETDNWILKYIKKRNPYSKINADFMIESTYNGVTMYIFLRKKSNGNYCICSFFNKCAVTYRGEAAYWLLKKRIHLSTNEAEIIFEREIAKH